MGNVNNYTVGDMESLTIFEEYSNHKERIKKNSAKHKEDSMYSNIEPLKSGDTYGGMLIDIYEREYIFDVGYKTHVNVVLTSSEIPYLSPLKIGDYSQILIKELLDGKDQYLIYGSVSAAKEVIVRNKIFRLEDNVVEAYIKEMNSSGYNAIISFDGIPLNAFMPHKLAGANKILDINRDKLVGQTLSVCIDGYIAERGTYIVDRKEYLRRIAPDLVRKLEKNILYKGVVTGTAEFGIFVEFNECLTGMIYKSCIADEFKDIIFKEGMEIEFYVKDFYGDKIILTQVLKDSMWDVIKVGDKMEGTVKAVVGNGILVSFDEETNGMIRKNDSFMDFKNYQVGSPIMVDIINIDRNNRKIFLSDK